MKVPMVSVTPTRTSVRIHGRCGIHPRCCIDRIFLHHHSRRGHNNWPTNDDGLGRDYGSRLRYNDTGRGSVLVSVSFTLIGGTTGIGRYRQVGGRCRRGKS